MTRVFTTGLRNLRYLIALCTVLMLAGSPASAASPPEATLQFVTLGQPSPSTPGYLFTVYANHSLDSDLSMVKEVIFIQHGIKRDGDNYFETGAKLVAELGADPATTLIIAPDFFNLSDPSHHEGLAAAVLWSGDQWAAGANAVSGPPVSSYQVMDDLVARFADHAHYPNMQRIVVAGHSDGGQMVMRYAVLNNIDEKIRAAGIDLSYVVANPSSYLYFNTERPSGSTFAVFDPASCGHFNQWRYGLENIVPYGQGVSAEPLFKRYLDRHVTYLLGTHDIDPAQRVLDRSCSAETQGAYRLERGHNYWRYEAHISPDGAHGNHRAFDVIGVAHNQSGMLASQCGATLLFGGGVTAASGAQCSEFTHGP